MSGDEEIVAFAQIFLVRIQRCLNGGVARIGNGTRRQTTDTVGVIQIQDILRNAAGSHPAHIFGRGRVPQIVVFIILHDIAAGIRLQDMAGPKRIGGFQPVVETGGDFAVLLRFARFLLNEGGQNDHIVQRGALGRDGVQQTGRLGIELLVEGVHVIVDGVIFKKFIGIREEIPLALHNSSVVGNLVPERILAEIRAIHTIGAIQKLLHVAQPILLHDLGNAHAGGPLREGHHHGFAEHVLYRQCGNDLVVGHTGAEPEGTVLHIAGLTAVFGIQLEQPVIFNDALFLQVHRDGGNAGPLHHHKFLLGACFAAAAQLLIPFEHLQSAKSHQRHQDDEYDKADQAAVSAAWCLLLIFLLILRFRERRFRGFRGRPGGSGWLRFGAMRLRPGRFRRITAVDSHTQTPFDLLPLFAIIVTD